MSTQVPGSIVIYLGFLHNFVLAKLATSSIWVKCLIRFHIPQLSYHQSKLVVSHIEGTTVGLKSDVK